MFSVYRRSGGAFSELRLAPPPTRIPIASGYPARRPIVQKLEVPANLRNDPMGFGRLTPGNLLCYGLMSQLPDFP